MFSVALIGPDGCGKSTISKHLLQDPSFKSKRIYMGVDRAESNYALPTTILIRWLQKKLKRGHGQGGPRDFSVEKKSPSGSLPKKILITVKSTFVAFNNIAEEWYRQLLAWYFMRAGNVVIFDRHFFADFYHYDINGRDNRWASRLHGYLLKHLYPKPDMVIYLDAPAELLFARKNEGTIPLLEERRQNYLDLKDKVPCFEVVDTTQDQEAAYADVRQLILNFLQNRASGD